MNAYMSAWVLEFSIYGHRGRYGASDDSLSRADCSTESGSQAIQTSSPMPTQSQFQGFASTKISINQYHLRYRNLS